MLATLLLFAGCVNGRRGINISTNLTKKEVLLIAKAKAIQEGFDLDDFDMTGCHYEYIGDEDMWTVFFEMKPPIVVGGHFLVEVNDVTRESILMHGQ